MGLHGKKNPITMNSSMNGALLAWKTRFVVLVCIFPLLWDMKVPSVSYASARSQYIINWAATQCGILTSVDSDDPVQPPFKLTNSKRCSVSSLTLIEYSSDYSKGSVRLCICAGWSGALLIVGNLMSRLNYILSRHRTQSRTLILART